MEKHVYFTRIEHINNYVNARPIFEIFGDGIEAVERESIGPHGTITIAGAKAIDELDENGKYLVFSITEEEFNNLEQTNNGPRIRAKDFIHRSRPVDAYLIREVVRIPNSFSIESYNSWSKEVFTGIQTPMTKNVYLYNNYKVYGPFKYQSIENNGLSFSPNSSFSDNPDPNVIRCYDESELKSSLKGIPDYQTERISYGEYDRYILCLNALPSHYDEIDCISDSALKSIIGNLLSTDGMTRAQRAEFKASINALPDETISEKRRERILQLAENDDLADIALKLIPTVVSPDSRTGETLLSKIFSNRDYVNKLYPIIKEQEGFSGVLERLEAEKAEKIHELDQLSAQVKEQETQKVEGTSISSGEIDRLQNIIIEKENEIEQYKKRDLTSREISDMKSEIKELQETKRVYEREFDNIQDRLKKRVQESYTSLAFDGPIASMMMEEAAKFEKRRKEELIINGMNELSGIEFNNEILTPSQLVDYLWNKLNTIAHRTIEKNDVANILLCISQNFLTIFAGEPGVGKTSFVNMLATLMGLNNPNVNRFIEVAVEKGWTSRRDLIGYYNPLTKVFDSSNRGLFDALLAIDKEKRNDKCELPYWILLDEANLSPMEHYWADFMGICDLNKNVRIVNLGEDYQFMISDALRFFATINLDHTTEALSARLIDRAWVIKLDNPDLDFDEYQDSELDSYYPSIRFSVLQQLYEVGKNPSEKMDDILVEKFNMIKDIFQSEGYLFSPRIVGMIKKYCIASKQVMNLDKDENSNSYVALDYAVAQKILPMINGYGENYSKFIEKLIEECDETTMPKSNYLLRSILRNGRNNMQNYQFFGR